MFKYYVKVLMNYAVFSGRARRREYWMFVLCNTVIIFSGMFIGIMSLIMTGGSDSDVIIATLTGFGWVYAFVVAIPSIAVVVRRLHDTGRSGGYYFISFIPLIGSIWLLALMCQEGDYGDNAYGPDPKKV